MKTGTLGKRGCCWGRSHHSLYLWGIPVLPLGEGDTKGCGRDVRGKSFHKYPVVVPRFDLLAMIWEHPTSHALHATVQQPVPLAFL